MDSVDLDFHFREHPSEDELEAYALRHLPEDRTAAVETHLLICERCQNSLAEIDAFIASMKAVTAELSAPRPRIIPPSGAPVRWQIALGALAAGLIAVGFFFWDPAPPTTPATILLSAMRDGTTGAPSAAAGSPLNLEISSTQLDGRPGFRVEIVTHLGSTVWSSPVSQAKAGQAAARVDKRLPAGEYWVRLYGPDNRFLQEYGLQLR